MFYLMFLLIPLGLFFVWSIQHRKAAMAAFAPENLLKQITNSFSWHRVGFKYGLLVLAVACCIVALARPQWGFVWQEIKRKGIDILIVIDTSQSMLAQDVKPNRLERTKLAVRDLLLKLRGDRVGLIAFAGDAFLVCPLTADYNGFLLSLNDLSTETIPHGGTNIGIAIEEAMKGYAESDKNYKAVIIITDGDNLQGEPLTMAEKAKEKGIQIYTVGIGTPEGELIQVRDRRGNLDFIKDQEGNVVKSRLNEKLLSQIAALTGGLYVRSSGAQFGLDYIFDQRLSKLDKREFESTKEKLYFERYQFPLGAACLLFMIEACLSVRRPGEE